ncbi:MAG TPA: MTAP family purine nucleoside phosphorylase [Solirubrobacterales bacterium]|nr:MTAP family purine nucleoside phosphorylase [Solirubrobacterales bacterium]
MGRLAVVLGSSALGPGGETIAAAAAEHGAAIVQRHGEGDYVLPHEVDHVANLGALAEQGCDRVLAVGSVGSLSPQLPVGSLLCPDDFIALHLGLSAFSDERAHRAPGFDPAWRAEVLAAWQACPAELRDGGVYWQAIGPRFETPAEIRLMAAHADVVGMTIASECIVAAELGLAYAAVCVVDNLANGIGARPLQILELEAARAANALQLHDGLAAVLPQLGAVGP